MRATSAQLCSGCSRDFFGGDLDAEAQDLPDGNTATTGAPHPCLLKPSEVAVRLGVSRSWVYAAAADGRLPSVRLGGPDGPLRFVAEDLDAWIEAARRSRRAGNTSGQTLPRPARLA